MPLVRIDVIEGRTDDELRALADERIMPVEKERLVEFANRLRERLENP